MTVKEHLVELREFEDDELATQLREAKEELFNLRFQSATGQLDSHGRLNAVRKNIARIYTIMRERELGIGHVMPPAPRIEEEPAPAKPSRSPGKATQSAAGDESAVDEAPNADEADEADDDETKSEKA